MDLQSRLQSALGPSYRLDRELGGGGMSRVFAAEEVRLGRAVVVKVLPPEMAAGVSADRFEREILLAAKLQHPHIVPLLTAGAAGDLLYYIMPRVEGESLRARLAREHELPVGEAVRILHDVADALAYAHAHGIVHRDVKPDNVLLSGKHALVTDFGVAKAVAESTGKTALTSLGVALGTPAYMAPEQATADPSTDHRADIYAIGALAYETLTGRPPFTGPTAQAVLAAHMTSQPEPVTKYRDTVPPALAALVMRCLAKHPADRWQSATEISEQLEQMATPTGGMVPTGAETPISSGTAAAIRRAHPARVAGLFALASLGVLALVRLLVRLLGLPDWAFATAVGLLAAGLPIMLWTGVIERRRALARTTGRSAVPAGVARWFTWRRALLGGVGAFGVLGLGTAVYMAMRLLGIGPVGTLVASGALAERDRLVLADFANRTADSGLGPSVSEAFRVDLTQSPVVRLLDGATVAAALRRMNRAPGTPLDFPLAQEVAQREGAKAVVRGDIGPVGRGYVLSAEVVSAADGHVLVAVRETAKDDGAIIEAVDRLSKTLRERIGESLRTIRGGEPLEAVTTGSLEALRKYSEAVRVGDQGDLARAEALLQEAVALDTGFAMAYRKLAVVLSNSFAARSRIVAAATKAFEHRDRLPPLERYLTTAYYYDDAANDRDKAISAYRSALQVSPDDPTALNNLARALGRMRAWAEAESLALRAIATGQIAPPYVNAASAQVAQGKLAEARNTIDLLAQRAPGNPLVPFFRAQLAAVQRRFDSAAVYSAPLMQARDPSWQSATAGLLASLALVRGKLADAERAGTRAMALSEQRSLPGEYLGGAAQLALIDVWYRNTPAAGIARVEAALGRHPLAAMAPTDRPYSGLAFLYARAGRPARARELLKEYETTVPEAIRRGDDFRHEARAATAMAEGRVQEAIAEYRAGYDSSNCAVCGLFHLGQAYERAGQPDSALAVYERAIATPGLFRLFEEATTLGPTYKRLGELYEQRGERAKARDYYGRFVDLWKDADPELQPLVRDVRQRLARLTAEGAK